MHFKITFQLLYISRCHGEQPVQRSVALVTHTFVKGNAVARWIGEDSEPARVRNLGPRYQRLGAEFSKMLLETLTLPRASRPPGGLAARSETIDSATYRGHWVPRSRFAVSPRPGCAVFRRRIGPVAVKRSAADSRRASASLWSFAQRLPARPPQRMGSSHGLSFPSAHAGFGDRFGLP
jgi:hypothetical protein